MYKVLTADPPWQFSDSLPGKSRGASKNYETLNLTGIIEFPIPEMEKDSVLFLWRVAAMPEEALKVCRAWGFKPYTEMVWNKTTVNGKQWFGMGRLLRNSHESVLIGIRGKPQRKIANIRSAFSAPYTKHSGKPEAFYDIVEELIDGPYVELFARRQRQGWTCIGKDI